jgi:hypothetical protein
MTFLSSELSLDIASLLFHPVEFSLQLSSATYGMITLEQEVRHTCNRTLEQSTFQQRCPSPKSQRDFCICAANPLERSIGSGFEEVTNEFDS